MSHSAASMGAKAGIFDQSTGVHTVLHTVAVCSVSTMQKVRQPAGTQDGMI